MVNILHEAREPLVDALSHRACARISASDDPDHAVSRDRFQDIENVGANLPARLFFGIYRRKTCFLRMFFGHKRHQGGGNCCDYCRRPKNPAPMLRWDPPHPKQQESSKERGAKPTNGETAGVDHESEDAGKSSARVRPKPGGVYLDHSRRAERLQVSVDPANSNKQSENSPKRRHAEKKIHRDGAERA